MGMLINFMHSTENNAKSDTNATLGILHPKQNVITALCIKCADFLLRLTYICWLQIKSRHSDLTRPNPRIGATDVHV